jgi:hypothetical protein
MAAVEDSVDLFGDEEDDGLFGDEDGSQSPRERRLSDDELDSGDDVERNDRGPVTEGMPRDSEQELIADWQFSRQHVPTPTDGEVRFSYFNWH